MPDLWIDVDSALSEVPVNVLPLIDDTDFTTREESVAYNASGLELIWHFMTTAGSTSATVVTPTTGGDYDWTHQDGGLYTIEIPASGGASINNDTEGVGWFSGVADGVLPWRGPLIGFRAAGVNDSLIDAGEALATSAQVGNLAVSAGGISTTAESFTKAGAEPETNTYTSTVALDGTYHIVEDDATSTDVYYQFDVGPNGVPIEVEWLGYAQSNGDSYGVYFYNFGGASWEQVATLTASNGTTASTEIFIATVAHVGTGANVGKVRLRFASSDGTAIATDRILCTYAVINAALGYDLAAVWVDESNGTSSGTTTGVDGLVTNRCDDFDNAQTIADALGYGDIRVTNGNSITLSAALEGYDLHGNQVTLALGTQNIGDSEFFDFKSITGTGTSTGGRVIFTHCDMGNCTLPGDTSFTECGLGGTITIASTGDLHLIDCYSQVAGATSPVVDMGSGVGATTASFRRWSGGLTLNNVAAGDVVSVDALSGGTITVNGTGGSVYIRGVVDVVDGSSGSVTIVESSVLNMAKIPNVLASGTAQAGAAGTITLASGDAAANDEYNYLAIEIVDGTGAGQVRWVYDYVNSTKIASITPDWTTNPSSDSVYRILPVVHPDAADSADADDWSGSLAALISTQLGLITASMELTTLTVQTGTTIDIYRDSTRVVELTYPYTATNGNLDLTGVTVKLAFEGVPGTNAEGDSVSPITGTVSNGGSASQSVSFTVPKATTATMQLSKYGATSQRKSPDPKKENAYKWVVSAIDQPSAGQNQVIAVGMTTVESNAGVDD